MSITKTSQHDTLPGLPDALPRTPPKANAYQGLTLNEAIASAHNILDQALAGTTINIETDPPKPQETPTYTSGSNQCPATRVATGTQCRRPRQHPDHHDDGAGAQWTVKTRTFEPPDAVFTLFSGGGDSTILAHLMRERGYPMIHVRTGISIPATWTYVQAVAKDWQLDLRAVHPDDTYEDLVLGRVLARTGPNAGRVVWKGFPGPAAHYLMFQRLKERALEKIRNEVVRATLTKTGTPRTKGRPGQILFLAGMRWAESDRRFINAEEYDPWGSVLWVSPIVWWTQGHMAEYRARYMCHDQHTHAEHRLCRPGVLPLSEVTANLHMSGDCLCGAYAKPGELDEIAFFYPEVADHLRRLAAQAQAEGIDRCIWGEGKRKGDPKPRNAGRLCSSCIPLKGQGELADDWLARGLISNKLHLALGGSAA